MILERVSGPTKALSQVCYTWRLAAISFPRPVVFYPTSLDRSELLVPTTLMPRGTNTAKSAAAEHCGSFRYIALPALRAHRSLRLIGGSPSVPLFVDLSSKKLVTQRFTGPSEGLPNTLTETLLSIDLPDGVKPQDITCGIFSVGSSKGSPHLPQEVRKINTVLIATECSIFGLQVKDCRPSGHWATVHTPLLPFQTTGRRFSSAISFGGIAYFMDQSHRLLTCNMDISSDLCTKELFANRSNLIDCRIEKLQTCFYTCHLQKSVAQI